MSSGFITEAEIEEKRRVRQLEWDEVRKPEDPVEAPEEPKDHRSLFERLQEQKNKKQEEFEEAHKLKNLVKVLDDDEVEFLDYVDKAKMEEEKRKRMEEAKELSEFRSEVSKLREKELDDHIKQEIGLAKPTKTINKLSGAEDLPSIGTNRTSQTKLLAGIVKRKIPSTSEDKNEPPKKLKLDDTEPAKSSPTEVLQNSTSNGEGSNSVIESVPYMGNLVCIGVLPGLASYTNSSDESDDDVTQIKDSSDSESDISPSRDLCGRRIIQEDQRKDCK